MGTPPTVLHLRPSHWREMRGHVSSEYPLEACGLIGGLGARSKIVIPVSNVAASDVRFRMDPEEQIKAMLQIEQAGLSLIGIYHSHPAGPSGPSATDYREAAYPEAAYLVWFREGDHWSCEAYDLIGNPGERIQILVEEE